MREMQEFQEFKICIEIYSIWLDMIKIFLSEFQNIV